MPDKHSASPQSVCVTGAAQGLGAVIARAFHEAGWRVALADLDEAGASTLASELDPSGESAMPLALDVRSQEQFEAAADAMVSRWDSVQALVNNAVVTKAEPVLDIEPEDFNSVMEVNAGGTFIGSQVFGRLFKQAGYGRIVNIASLAGQNGGAATGAHYAASKGAIVTLTKVFARDLAAFGVTVNAIAPGPLDLPSVRALVPADKLEGLIAGIPAGKLGEPALIADIVLRLAAADAGYVTGATWDANGGLFMR